MICGFQSGTSGISRAVSAMNSWRWRGASPSSGLLGRSSSAGLTPTQGGSNQSTSEFESVLPGSRAGPTNSMATAR
jgi:hypothetical protein